MLQFLSLKFLLVSLIPTRPPVYDESTQKAGQVFFVTDLPTVLCLSILSGLAAAPRNGFSRCRGLNW